MHEPSPSLSFLSLQSSHAKSPQSEGGRKDENKEADAVRSLRSLYSAHSQNRRGGVVGEWEVGGG